MESRLVMFMSFVVISASLSISIASVSGSCYGTFAWTISVCQQSLLWKNGWVDPDAVWGGEWGRSRNARVLDGVVIVERKGSFVSEFGASHCNQWRLCNAALLKLLWALVV